VAYSNINFCFGSNPYLGVSIHHLSGWKYAIISNVFRTNKIADSSSLCPMVLALENSVQGGLAVMMEKYPGGYFV
jgi:hypothetical protein